MPHNMRTAKTVTPEELLAALTEIAKEPSPFPRAYEIRLPVELRVGTPLLGPEPQAPENPKVKVE